MGRCGTRFVEIGPAVSQIRRGVVRIGPHISAAEKTRRSQSRSPEAIKIDSKFVSPYGELATMAAVQQKWGDVDQYTSQMLKLNPYVVPEIYFYSAVANYNLQKLDLAERRAKEAAKADAQHRIPRINHLLGAILADKHDYKGAAESLQIYLKYSPDAKDADAVKQQLAEIEKALAAER